MSTEQWTGHLDTLILSVLETGPAHGYQAIVSLRERSDGVFELPEGTVYPALHRLERAGLLSSRRVVHAGRERRVYRLSARGRTALRSRRGQWREFSSAVTRVLEGSPA
jgi:DNA-binding PadR family transcriptional regulator